MYLLRDESYSSKYAPVDNHYFHTVLGCAHEQKTHRLQWAVSIGVVNKKSVFAILVGLATNSEANEARFQRICCAYESLTHTDA
jgi:hypothetical protein